MKFLWAFCIKNSGYILSVTYLYYFASEKKKYEKI